MTRSSMLCDKQDLEAVNNLLLTNAIEDAKFYSLAKKPHVCYAAKCNNLPNAKCNSTSTQNVILKIVSKCNTNAKCDKNRRKM